MTEQEKQDINIPIEAKIKATKGLKLGDDRFNPLEKKLLDDIIVEHGEAIASTREAMNADFSNLLEDVADLSEGNQRQLREVAEMLGVTLKTKDGGLQMNYELFQKILMFQRDNKMKLTGVVDKTLHAALKEKMGKKPAETPEQTTPTEAEKKETPYTGYTPTEEPKTREEIIQSIAEKPYINSNSAYPVGIQGNAIAEPIPTPVKTTETETADYERIPPPPLPSTPTGIASVGVQASVNAAPSVAAQPTNTPSAPTETKPVVKALPVEEAAKKTAEVEQVITEEAKKLGITIDDINLAQSPFGQSIVDMILYYEGPGGSRQSDTGGTYDIGGGINTGSSSAENKYALGENYEAWNSSFIPKEHVRESVQKLLHSRIALTRKSCGDKGIDFDALPQNVKAVLVDLHYNMPNNINEFTKFWAAIKDKNWQEAGRQLVDNGSGNPSGYLNQVAGRAYANAMILTTGDTTGFRRFKEEGGTDRQGLFDKFNASAGEYGKKVGMGERKDILENAENAADILSQTTSVDVLKTKGSTKSVIKILDKYLQEHPEKREEMIQALRAQIGDFSRPLQTPEEVGAFQQLFYLAYPDRFANEVGYIDGDYGPKTKETFMRDIFVMGGWQEKMEGSNGILNKSPAEIATYISGLSEFEKEILKKHYTSGNVNENSSKDEIIKAQLGLALSGVDIPINGLWDEKMQELLEYPELAKSLGDFVQNNYITYAGGAFSCGASVGRMLNGFGIEGLPQSDRDGKNWNEFLDARPDQFVKVKINSPDEAKPGGILCFDGGGTRPRSYMAIRHGHVEVKGSDGGFYYYKRGNKWGGSAGANLENSKFTGFVYYPRKKSIG